MIMYEEVDMVNKRNNFRTQQFYSFIVFKNSYEIVYFVSIVSNRMFKSVLSWAFDFESLFLIS